jgi:hypothetical protein
VVEKPVEKTEAPTVVPKKPAAKKAAAPVVAPAVKPAVASNKPQAVAQAAAPAVAPPAKPALIATAAPVVKPAVANSAPQPVVPVTKTTPAAGAQQVTLHASELSWVDACADGRVVFAKAFNAGETGQIKFLNAATIRTGNAGGLEITFGAKPAERMGAKGVIQMWKFTAAGRQEVPPNSASACAVH